MQRSAYSKLALVFGVFLVLYFTAPSLNPFDSSMFTFHDITQVGRVTSFVGNLKAGILPPRFAPEFSFNLGFPVFNYYAPFAYWLTSLIALLGVAASTAVKTSFLLTVLCAFLGMYYFLTRLFLGSEWRSWAALLGASVYVTATYFASEIVVRGNLAESWFLALFPLALGLVIENSSSKKRVIQIITPLVLSFVFTAHNVLSLFAMPLVVVFLLFFPHKKRNLLAVFLALLIGSYFLIPAFAESPFVQAAAVAKQYPYGQHFLCPWQLWSANGWQFGGSLPGCDADTMSFKIGKLQLLLGALGAGALCLQIVRTKKITKKILPIVFIAVITLGSLFLTLSYSKFFWDFFSEIMALFQFPWRFLAFAMFGTAVLAGYLFSVLRLPFQQVLVLVLILVLFVTGRKYFIKPMLPFAEFNQTYNSAEYLHRQIAYKMPEYVVQHTDYNYWHSLNVPLDKPFQLGFDPTQPIEFAGSYKLHKNSAYEKILVTESAGEAHINLHYFPFWGIYSNEKKVTPQQFDKLARPVITVAAGDQIHIKYQQTKIEKVSNLLTLLGLVLIFITVQKNKR